MFKDVGLDLLGSKKFMMAILALLAAAAARIGLHFTATEALAFISPVIAAILGQGYADGGKSAAQINERTALHQLAAARARMGAPLTGDVVIESNTPAPPSPATGMRVASGAGIVALIALMILGSHAGCGTTAAKTAGNAIKSGGSAWLACEKADLGQIADANGNSLLSVVALELLSANYVAAISTLIGKFGNDAIGCAVLAVEAVAKAQKPATNAMPTPLEIRASEMIQAHGWRPAPATAKP